MQSSTNLVFLQEVCRRATSSTRIICAFWKVFAKRDIALRLESTYCLAASTQVLLELQLRAHFSISVLRVGDLGHFMLFPYRPLHSPFEAAFLGHSLGHNV
jgi:hypothetical protein